MSNQKGFTLIELVVVIVILGILAAVAAPKFIDISSDARKSTLEGLEGAVKSGNSMLFSKAIIEAKESKDAQTVDGIVADYGYVAVDANGAQMALLLETTFGATEDWNVAVETADTSLLIFPNGITAAAVPSQSSGNRCYLRYTQATSSDKPLYAIVSDDC